MFKRLMLLLSWLLVTPAFAQGQCELNIEQAFAVEGSQLSVGEAGANLIRFKPDGLWVGDSKVELSSAQQAMVEEYRQGFVKQTPELVALVEQAIAMLEQTLTSTIAPLLNEDNTQQLNQLINDMKARADSVAGKNQLGYYFKADDDTFENLIDEKTQQQMEALMQSVAGQFMAEIGAQMMSGDGASGDLIQKRMEQMQNLGNDIESKMRSQAKALEAKAEKVCKDIQALLPLEHKLAQEIEPLKSFEFVKAG
ncbi:DUF2884 family protein [Paraferrimonas haliotis]|uniref:DUF2884 family protein n=1 Tax=Paraferrimonas haliotis TaxID=2013866 RepID=A0AA37WYC4_9GAMM|nr:DUF2884 family protein [Paraferrimonas haliotis]GLS83630.1 hypothetical protein GCM10007894_16070 [Paraferrimonas haliotis]